MFVKANDPMFTSIALRVISYRPLDVLEKLSGSVRWHSIFERYTRVNRILVAINARVNVVLYYQGLRIA